VRRASFRQPVAVERALHCLALVYPTLIGVGRALLAEINGLWRILSDDPTLASPAAASLLLSCLAHTELSDPALRKKLLLWLLASPQRWQLNSSTCYPLAAAAVALVRPGHIIVLAGDRADCYTETLSLQKGSSSDCIPWSDLTDCVYEASGEGCVEAELTALATYHSLSDRLPRRRLLDRLGFPDAGRNVLSVQLRHSLQDQLSNSLAARASSFANDVQAVMLRRKRTLGLDKGSLSSALLPCLHHVSLVLAILHHVLAPDAAKLPALASRLVDTAVDALTPCEEYVPYIVLALRASYQSLALQRHCMSPGRSRSLAPCTSEH
jgi:hypothetical protein